uniref:Secreted protein n=1 Tax=Mus musculus TaxID=10090 RepID=Q3UEY6_MOUSE|nr:unnamed protein product [Mus musculus]
MLSMLSLRMSCSSHLSLNVVALMTVYWLSPDTKSCRRPIKHGSLSDPTKSQISALELILRPRTSSQASVCLSLCIPRFCLFGLVFVFGQAPSDYHRVIVKVTRVWALFNIPGSVIPALRLLCAG